MRNLDHSRIPAVRLFATGLLLARTGSVLAEVHYVDLNSTDATPPYTNWPTAATNIQDAVEAAVAGDEVVLNDRTYYTGRDLFNIVAVDQPLSLRRVSGPQSTIIDGFGLGFGCRRCAYLTNGASLAGFTLVNGSADYSQNMVTNPISGKQKF